MAMVLDPVQCRVRQQRLLAGMQRLQLDSAVFTQAASVQWLTGCYFPYVFQPALLIRADGSTLLVAPNQPPEGAAADRVICYEAQWHSTLRNDQRSACSEQLLDAVGRGFADIRLGVEFSSFPVHLGQHAKADLIDLEPVLYQLRRKKQADELALMRKAIGATEAMYAHAREIMAPGVNELQMFNALQSTAVEYLGEMLTGTGNDYQVNSRGGPPRAGHQAVAGELYILDLGPGYRGYFADNCRTLAVTDADQQQQEAWEKVTGVFDLIRERVKPGVRCREIFEAAQAHLDQAPHGVFDHHLGHGVGLFPHEAPHLNPLWDDTFAEGDVFTAEPGLYAPELRAGMRIENNYLVTATGVELLSDFPLEL